MNLPHHFEPTRAAALARIAAVCPGEYARSRNALGGAVTQLSPYITHGFVSLPEVLASVVARDPIDIQHKFVFELGWREFFRHVWQHRGGEILHSLHDGLLPDHGYSTELPADVRQARTGVPAIDQAVRSLYATGYLHNHARMWLASYVVHLRKVHWRVGADWLVTHLLDGDLASNHLSWQWVAGTGSSKPYVFNADNVARYAPPQWHSRGSLIDASYEQLNAMACSPRPVKTRSQGEGVSEPTRHGAPPATALVTTAPQAADVAGQHVWLVHPWALGDPPSDLPQNTVCVGLCLAEFHTAWPWSEARWVFVGERMRSLASVCWHTDSLTLAQALAGARSVQTLADPHISPLLPRTVRQRQPLRLFADVDFCCHSFFSWWKHSTRSAKTLNDLPGLAALANSNAWSASAEAHTALTHPKPAHHNQ